jgi:mannose-6-phosphate isomerase class I
LHLDAALAVADLGCHPGASAPVDLGEGRRLLVECPYFRTESLAVGDTVAYAVTARTELLICLEGAGRFGEEAFAPGEVWVVPAHAAAFHIHANGGARFLRVCVP